MFAPRVLFAAALFLTPAAWADSTAWHRFLDKPPKKGYVLTPGATVIGPGVCKDSAGLSYDAIIFQRISIDFYENAVPGKIAQRCGMAAVLAAGMEPKVRGIMIGLYEYYDMANNRRRPDMGGVYCYVFLDTGFADASADWVKAVLVGLGDGWTSENVWQGKGGTGEVTRSQLDQLSLGGVEPAICYRVEPASKEDRDAQNTAVSKQCEGSGNGHKNTAQTGSVCCPSHGTVCCTWTSGNNDELDAGACCSGPSGNVCSEKWDADTVPLPRTSGQQTERVAVVAVIAVSTAIAASSMAIVWRRTRARAIQPEFALAEFGDCSNEDDA